MIEIDMPGDITEYEPKLIGSLTTRQTVCFLLGGVLGFLGYTLAKGTGMETTLLIVLAFIPVLCGIWKPQGIPLEKFAIMVFFTYFLPPKIRKYKIDNMYEECFEHKTAEEEKNDILRSRKKKQQNRKSKNDDLIDFK